MARKGEHDYFAMFVGMVEVSREAAENLAAVMKDFHPDALGGTMQELHAIESRGDERKHVLMERLAKEFIAPIEREDILALANEIDDVTDAIEDVLLKIYMYNIQEMHADALEFVDIVERCCNALFQMMQEFHNFKKSKTIQQAIIEINRLEELGDHLYIKAVRTLYEEKSDPYATMAWSKVYSSLEKCCDTCEHVADVVEGVIMKNT